MKNPDNQISSRIRKAVGIGVVISTSILSLIEFLFFYRYQHLPFIEAIAQPSVIIVFFTGLIFLSTSFLPDILGKSIQVTIIILSGLLSATQAGSGDFSSFVIVALGYLLSYEYGFLRTRIVLKTSVLAVVYSVFLTYSLLVLRKLTFTIAIHTLVGAGMILFISFILLKAQGEKAKLRRNDLERKVSERTEELKKTLGEKETLLREVHHRTKNNMQLISSLLNLEYSSVTDKKAIEAARKSMRRIQALSTAHEYLHHSSNISNINLHDYVHEFLNLIIGDMNMLNISFSSSIEEGIGANIEAAIPFGLVINEIISNSLKHAFKDDAAGHIRLDVTSNEDVVILTIGDDGIGIPAEIEIESTDSIGINIVVGLIDQLYGTYKVDRENGTKWIITLPLETAEVFTLSDNPIFYLTKNN